MKVAVNFQEERLEFDVPEDRLVGEWHGPEGTAAEDVESQVLAAIENPQEYPPLAQAIVPGDHVAIALDPGIPNVSSVLGPVCRVLEGREVGEITVLVPEDARSALVGAMPGSVALVGHDPTDRTHLAYLASTKDGSRVYLNRLVTDADFVLPIGCFGYDRVLGYRGPWSTIYPDLSNAETRQRFQTATALNDPSRSPSALEESAEVSWLLGCQFHVGIVAGVRGPAAIVAGLESAMRDTGPRLLDASWRFRVESRAEMVVVGIGRPGTLTGIDDLARGLATAARLVRRGGKIVALSRAQGSLGRALRRLGEVDDPRNGSSALRGLEAEPDYPAAQLLARALAWADVYLLSGLGPDAVEELSIIPLEKPDEARRLVTTSSSCLVVSQAELTLADVADETGT
jgi:hypothetical protein